MGGKPPAERKPSPKSRGAERLLVKTEGMSSEELDQAAVAMAEALTARVNTWRQSKGLPPLPADEDARSERE